MDHPIFVNIVQNLQDIIQEADYIFLRHCPSHHQLPGQRMPHDRLLDEIHLPVLLKTGQQLGNAIMIAQAL